MNLWQFGLGRSHGGRGGGGFWLRLRGFPLVTIGVDDIGRCRKVNRLHFQLGEASAKLKHGLVLLMLIKLRLAMGRLFACLKTLGSGICASCNATDPPQWLMICTEVVILTFERDLAVMHSTGWVANSTTVAHPS